MKIIAKQFVGIFGVASVVLLVLVVGMRLYPERDVDFSGHYSDAEDDTKRDVAPLFGSGSETVPAYALYVVEDRRWVVNCYSIGSVYVTPDETSRFRSSVGTYLDHKAFCDLYL